jgi:hypothetical protein
MKRTRVDHDDEPVWTKLDWQILYAQMQHLREFWDRRLKLSYAEREKMPPQREQEQ